MSRAANTYFSLGRDSGNHFHSTGSSAAMLSPPSGSMTVFGSVHRDDIIREAEKTALKSLFADCSQGERMLRIKSLLFPKSEKKGNFLTPGSATAKYPSAKRLPISLALPNDSALDKPSPNVANLQLLR